MEIYKTKQSEWLELRLKGRLDGYWAGHLEKELEEGIRGGARHIRLDMAEITFLSSAGTQILTKYERAMGRLGGSFGVASPAAMVLETLSVSGLERLHSPGAWQEEVEAAEGPQGLRLEEGGFTFFVHPLAPGRKLRCRMVGDPAKITGASFGPEDMHTLVLPKGVFAVGLGAFGLDFEDCKSRFGEFLVAGGAAAYLPADGSNAPDYMVSLGAFFPEIHVLYAAVCDGEYSHFAHFEPKESEAVIPLSGLVKKAFEIAGSETIGLVAIVESAGLMGASLKRSPASGDSGGGLFAFPEIRHWLSFTPERVYHRGLALVAGIASREAAQDLAPMLRPLGRETGCLGHFHAAPFSYRPLPNGAIGLEETVASLFEGEVLHGVLHLLQDGREISGVGESEFVRGAMWVGAIEKSVRT
jgi:anti-anti-sigma factor